MLQHELSVESKMSNDELLARFEEDIVYGGHSLRAEYSRSKARRELQSRGPEVIVSIFRYLKSEKGRDYPTPPHVWAWLVKDI